MFKIALDGAEEDRPGAYQQRQQQSGDPSIATAPALAHCVQQQKERNVHDDVIGRGRAHDDAVGHNQC